jgi:hypothetical protein
LKAMRSASRSDCCGRLRATLGFPQRPPQPIRECERVGNTARTLQIAAFRSVETDTQHFHC